MANIIEVSGTGGGTTIVKMRYRRDSDGDMISEVVDGAGRVLVHDDGQRNDAYKEDAGETIFLAEQLKHVEAQVLNVERKPLDGLELIPISRDAPPYANTIAFRTRETTGAAKFVRDNPRDIPMISQGVTEATVPYLEYAIGYEVTRNELAAAQAYGINLDADGAIGCHQALDEFLNTAILLGYPQRLIKGFAGTKEVKRRKVTNAIDSNSTADQIIAEANNVINSVAEDSSGVEKPDTLALPLDSYTYMATTARSSTSDTTILEFLAGTNPYVKGVQNYKAMAGLMALTPDAAVGESDWMMAYSFDPSKVDVNAQPPMMLEVQKVGLCYVVVFTAKVSSVKYKKPGSAHIRWGV